jgi:GNAT superfamily N-acetyltransferase
MPRWTTDGVLAASASWVWVPPEAQQVVTNEYQLIAYPPRFLHPTLVAWSASVRPASELVAEVAAQVQAWNRDTVYWWVRDSTRPADTESLLLARSATLEETVQVLAFDLSTGAPALSLPEPSAPDGPRAEVVRDEAGLRASHLVAAEVWEHRRARTDTEIASELADVATGLRSWSDFRVVVYLDGEPAASGGCTLTGDVARLWGAGTRPAFRGRGAYRALLAARIAVATEHGATLALVKGRVQTSGPILRRAGFTSYGEERCYRLLI